MTHYSSDSHCPNCHSENIHYDKADSLYTCTNCDSQWAHFEPDPDQESRDSLFPEDFVAYETILPGDSGEVPEGVEPTQTIAIVETGKDEEGYTIMRFMSTLPGDAYLQNGFTVDGLYESMRESMANRKVKLVRD